MKKTYTHPLLDKVWIKVAALLVLLAMVTIANAQQGSSGNTTIFNGAQMTFFGSHDFVTGGGGTQPGVINTIRTSPIGVLNFAPSANMMTGADDANYVDGYVRKLGTTPFIFPVGDNNRYGPFAAAGDGTTGAYFFTDATTAITSMLPSGNYPVLPAGGPFSTASKAAGVLNVSTVEYWDIDGTNVTPLSLTWDATSAIGALTASDLTKLTIVGWNGTQWVAIPSTVDATSVLGGASDLSVGSITTSASISPDTYTAYTFGSKETALLSTIVVAKKQQPETSPGVDFSFTSDIPNGGSFTLNDDVAYVAMQDVGMGGDNTIWGVAAPVTYPGIGNIYYRNAGVTNWVMAPGGATRIDVDQNGVAYIGTAGAGFFRFNGSGFTSMGGSTLVVDIGVSAGAPQALYVIAGAGACNTLYRWDGGTSYTGFPSICVNRVDVHPDGSVWVLNTATSLVSRVAISGTTAIVSATYPGTGFLDLTVAADGTVWAVTAADAYRLVGSSWVLDPNSGGITNSFGGISAGKDGDTPLVTYASGAAAPLNIKGRLIQRREDGGWFDDHAVRGSGAGNSVIYNVAPGTYTITENTPSASWELIKINGAGGVVSSDLIARTASVTVAAGQTAHVEFVNYNIQNSVISNECGTPFVETFGASGSVDPSFTSTVYTPYHPNGGGAGTYYLTNNQDHTPGDVGGYYMFVNGGFGQDEVFRRRFTGLVPGGFYTLSFWASNTTNATILPNLAMEVRTLAGSLLASQTTGNIAFTTPTDWRQYGLTFTADASGTADFIIRNNQQTPGTFGNDFAIDDIIIGVGCDFGDAPDSYGTSLASNGPSHKASELLKLGSAVDIEADGIPSADTNGDDNNGTSDENGISLFPSIEGGSTTVLTNYTVDIAVTNAIGATANLCGWIDWNSNGTFEAGEGVCTTVANGATTASLTWPSATLAGATGTTGVYGRFRLTADVLTSDNPTNAAANGEVEDYFIPLQAPLPVTLISFTAIKSESTSVLSWSTTTETNSDRFEVERSLNGKSWNRIGTVASQGESAVLRNYSFVDVAPTEGENLYRLKMVDRAADRIDETFAYSSIRAVRFAENQANLSVYPNPTSDKLHIRGYTKVTEVLINDVNGRIVQRSKTAANGNGQIDVGNLRQGMYIVKLYQADGTFSTHKIVISR